MYKGFKQLYYVKKLYFDAGKTIMDYVYLHHVNLVDTCKLKKLYGTIKESNETVYSFYDKAGRCFSLLCSIAAGQKNYSDTFIYKDECSSAGRLTAVYLAADNIFIYQNKNGQPLDKYYYRSDCMKKPVEQYIKLAEYYFEKSEYIAKNR